MPSLPKHPNLEHLRKQAKARLSDLRQRDPRAQLADAQLAVAREYGFPSWTKLKASVASEWNTSPFRGEWLANLAKSQRHANNAFQAARISIAVDDDVLAVKHSFVDDSGREHRDEQIVHADGISHELNNGYAMTATWRGSHVLETVATRNGVEVGRGRYEVTSDGRTLTISNAEQCIVLDRKED
jgi:hypothetical protein